MLNKIKSPAVIITALAFAAMVIVFVSHFQLTRDETASTVTTPIPERPVVETARAQAALPVETSVPEAESGTAVPEPPREVSYAEAEAAYLEGRYPDAVELFAAYTEHKTENPWGFYMLGLSAWKSGDNESAELAFERAIDLDPSHVKSYINLTRALLDAGKPTYALVRIHEAIELDPKSGTAHRLEGVALHAIGKRDEAVGAYRKAIEIDNTDAWAMNNLALVLIEEGDYEQALRALARATEVRDDVAVFFNNLGMALEHSGRFVQATDAYDRAVSIDGGYAKALENYNRVATVLEDPSLQPVDLAALASEFASEVDGWSDTVVASGDAASADVPPAEPVDTIEPRATAPVDSTNAGSDQ